MYIKIGKKTYPCTKHIKRNDCLKFLSVSPDPGTVSGTVHLYRDDGFLLQSFDTGDYIRQSYSGTILAFYKYPKPEPVETPHVPTDREILHTLLGV